MGCWTILTRRNGTHIRGWPVGIDALMSYWPLRMLHWISQMNVPENGSCDLYTVACTKFLCESRPLLSYLGTKKAQHGWGTCKAQSTLMTKEGVVRGPTFLLSFCITSHMNDMITH